MRLKGFVLLVSIFVHFIDASSSGCRINNSRCIVKAANKLMIPLVASSAKNAELPKLEPFEMVIPNMAQMNLKFLNPKYTGYKEAKILKISGFKSDPENNVLKVQIRIPKASIEGPYEFYGQFLLFKVDIKGQGSILLKNLDIFLTLQTKKILDDSDIYMKLVSAEFSYSVQRAILHFTNDDFAPAPFINDMMNKVLNNHWRFILKKMEGPINNSLAKFYVNLGNIIFDDTPYNELFNL